MVTRPMSSEQSNTISTRKKTIGGYIGDDSITIKIRINADALKYRRCAAKGDSDGVCGERSGESACGERD